mgnify:FL=1|jgi:flagellar basal-body rod protein FlgF
MDKMLFVAMNGAKQAMQAQNAISHNLANASTIGFKANLDTFTNWHVEGPGRNTRVFNQLEMNGSNMLAGNFATTNRELDVAVNGDGWIAVQAPDGTEAYTRAGDLRLDELGQLTNGVGRPVLGTGGPIIIPQSEKIEIGADGSISTVPVGQAVNALAVVDRIKLVNPPVDQLQKGPDGLFRMKDGQLAPAAADVTLASGVLEHSNVNAVAELVDLINNARQFEANVKLMTTAKENDEVSARLLRSS